MRLFAALTLSLLTVACGSQSSSSSDDFNNIVVTFPDGLKIDAEVVSKNEDMARGLMFRESLAPDHGMLFIHGGEGKYPYWMFNCNFPIDIIWMDHNRHVVEISANTPPCKDKNPNNCPTYGGHEIAFYVLEVGAGVAAKNKVGVGDTLSF